ncbi:hypothetical protein HETIRDRAFT_320784 [Heterobasidion irregulare TC 32-1]|uniref:Smr domain-containing protein n=1 Tax=Heterobasidion irregulare (strain TC 32-1) TaxID=747525 RepID=W4K3K2_HETIT|nr:uncharacterized protein HETIRDRAFT_320784 [Heterobasidion irregulare TC 32-1]ETW80413.1 hypothetical protein HETIRDRAFT_320784 [Heterobasidion irregulare TC 32-1]
MRKQAYRRGDRREAKRLSFMIKQKKEEAERLNTTAAERIFKGESNANNRRANDVDLHGLYVQEAIKFAEASITVSQSRGFSTLKLIVGKGLHTSDGIAKVKPAIEKMLERRGLVVAEQRGNAGALIVQLDSGARVLDDSDDSDVCEM